MCTGCLENAGDGVKSSLARVSQWRHAPAVSNIHVGSRRHQLPNDIGMHRPAIAENDGLQQRGPPQVVDVVPVNPCGKQDAHGFRMAMVRGRNECGAAVTVEAPEIGAVRQRHLQYFVTPFGTGIKKRAVIDIILGVDVGTGLNQHTRDLDAVRTCRDQQGRASMRITRIDVGTLVKKFPHRFCIAAVGGGNKRSIKRRIGNHR